MQPKHDPSGAVARRRATGRHREHRAGLLNVLAASVDARRADFPRPLSAPSSTWLADHGLEDLVRGATRRAVTEFANATHDLGAAEEEHLTATLLAGLAGEFTALPARTRLAGVAGPHLRVGHRTVTRNGRTEQTSASSSTYAFPAISTCARETSSRSRSPPR